jgi:hypothetical protein
MTAYFEDGKLYKMTRVEAVKGVIGDGRVEVPKDSAEYKEIYDLIARHPEWQEEAHWNERPAK